MKRKIFKIIGWIAITSLGVFLLGFLGLAVWGKYFALKADANFVVTAKENPSIKIYDNNQYISIIPNEASSKIGLIYYPGARVEPESYIYKLTEIAEKTGIRVYITKPLFNFAILGINDANIIRQNEKEITKWYVGGHSLGGSMACQYVAEIKDQSISGLILFGSYCGTDISKSKISVLSIAGSIDGLSTQSKIEQYKSDIPASATFVTIEGMNHAQNGNYGKQEGDNSPTTSDAFVIEEMSNAIKEFIKK